MIYPAQTSFIPIQVALARFLENQGFQAAFKPYPYWYLGTTPFHYLTGPVLPILLTALHKIAYGISLFGLMLALVAIAWIIGGIGVFWLFRTINEGKKKLLPAAIASFFYVFGILMPLMFRFSDGAYIFAFSFLPYILTVYLKLLKSWQTKWLIAFLLLTTFVLLINTIILPSLIIGLSVVFITEVGWRKIGEKFKKSLLLIFCCLLLATFWYTLGYWLVLLGSPSFAGKPLLGVIFWLGKMLPTSLAFIIAIFFTRFFTGKDKTRDFCLYWLVTYLCLTLLRFISDPDFWLDWTFYSLEIQFGLAFLAGFLYSKYQKHIIDNRSFLKPHKSRFSTPFFVFIFIFTSYFLLFLIFFKNYLLGTLQQNINQSVEYQIGSQLAKIVKPQEKVFLSGSTAFWLNAFFDIPQVRGGVDSVSFDKSWREAVWEIREGKEVNKSLDWLKKLNINYLVVHLKNSREFYHDFSNPEKFAGVKDLEKIYDKDGDRIYRLK